MSSIDLWSNPAAVMLATKVASAIRDKLRVDEHAEALDQALLGMEEAERAYQMAEATVGIAKRNLKLAEARIEGIYADARAQVVMASTAKLTESVAEAKARTMAAEGGLLEPAQESVALALQALADAELDAAKAKAAVNTLRQKLSVADLKLRLVIARIQTFQGLDTNPPPPAIALAGHPQKEA